MPPSHLLVTGGCGFIGCNFVRFVLAQRPNLRLTVLDKLAYAGNLRNLDGVLSDPRVTLVEVDTHTYQDSP